MISVALFLDKLFSPLAVVLAMFFVFTSGRWWNLVGVVLFTAVIMDISLPVMQILSMFHLATFLTEILAATVWVIVAVLIRRWWTTR